MIRKLVPGSEELTKYLLDLDVGTYSFRGADIKGKRLVLVMAYKNVWLASRGEFGIFNNRYGFKNPTVQVQEIQSLIDEEWDDHYLDF